MRDAGRLKYRCRRCRHHFTETSGTIFAKTRTPLSKWVLAIGLFKIGISARALQAELGMTYKTAWTMLDRIRQAVSGIRQRGGRVYTLMVPALDTQAGRELVRMYVRRGSRVYTDSLNIYRELQALVPARHSRPWAALCSPHRGPYPGH